MPSYFYTYLALAYITTQSVSQTLVSKGERWIGNYFKGRAIDLLSQYLPGGTEKATRNLSHNTRS
jgi:hypothetical protein